MAKKAGTTQNNNYKSNSKTKRPGVHSKKKNSVLKTSKNYKKLNKGQGR